MPTVLDAGSVPLSNADVLNWIRDKRAQHKREDAEDKAAGRKRAVRPANFMESLKNHESELTSKKLPYSSNPGAYEGQNRDVAVSRFMDKYDEAIVFPLDGKYRHLNLSNKELRMSLAQEQEDKALTPTEVLMIANLAPENANLLQNMIERSEARFDEEEQNKVVQIIKDIFRCGDKLASNMNNGGIDEFDQKLRI